MIWKNFLLSHHVNLNIPEGKRAERAWPTRCCCCCCLCVCVCVCVCACTPGHWERERENEKHKWVSQWVILLCARFTKSSELTLSGPMSTADAVNSLSHIPDISFQGRTRETWLRLWKVEKYVGLLTRFRLSLSLLYWKSDSLSQTFHLHSLPRLVCPFFVFFNRNLTIFNLFFAPLSQNPKRNKMVSSVWIQPADLFVWFVLWGSLYNFHLIN